MRILNLIPLVLMVSLIFAGCATQLPQQPALVIDTPDITDLTDETVVEDGFDIPGLDLGRGKGACRVVVKLIGVRYGGYNIGSEWNLNVSVNGQTWNSGPIVMHHGMWYKIDEQIYLNASGKGCYPINLLFFCVTARERDFLWLDDIGRAYDASMIPCLPKLSRRKLLMPVLVVERPDGIGQYKEARLDFLFEITSVCLTP